MKNTISVVLISLFIVACDSRPQSEHTKELLWIEKGKSSVREVLKESSSAEFGDVYFSRGAQGTPVACGSVKAKNSFGVFKVQKFISAGSGELTYFEQDVADFSDLWTQLCVPNNAPQISDGEGQLIPRTMAGDQGRYYLLEETKKENIVTVLHKRVGPSGTGFTQAKVDCKNNKIMVTGYGDDSVKNIKPNKGSTGWNDLVSGSSKGDLALFVCK